MAVSGEGSGVCKIGNVHHKALTSTLEYIKYCVYILYTQYTQYTQHTQYIQFFFFQIIINKRPLGNEYNTK